MSTIKVSELDAAVSADLHSSDLYLVARYKIQNSGALVVGRQYTIASFAPGDDFSNVATVVSGTINTSGCVFIATGTTPTNYTHSSTLTYYESEKISWNQLQNKISIPKVYRALLTQSGTSAPVATVLENSLSSAPVWSYDDVGQYSLTLSGEFVATKTMILFGIGDTASGNGIIVANDTTSKPNALTFIIYDKDTLTATNGLLYETSIQILVYP